MRRICFCIAVFVSVISISALLQAQSSDNTLTLYDNFNGRWIDPAKWDDWTQSPGMFEAVRELSPPYHGEDNNRRLRNRRLRIFQRAYSETVNDYDASYGWLGLQVPFNAIAMSIVDTSFTVSVNSVTLSGCQSNPDSHSVAWAGFVGRYFNYSGFSDAQDVEAGIDLYRDMTDAGTQLSVRVHVSSGDGFVNNYQIIGYVSLGQTAKLRVRWDRPNQQFLFQLNTHPVVSLKYDASDIFLPVNTLKAFWLGRGTPNCTTTPLGMAMMDAYFDNVYIGTF
jgi:hypothetical protein